MFKYIVAAMLLLTSLVSASAEAEQYPFFGMNVAHSTIDTDFGNEKSTYFGLKYGKQSLDWRTTFSYDYSPDYSAFSVEIDKMLLDGLFGTSKIRPYFGLSVGTLKLNYKKKNIDKNGYKYGAKAGFVIYATDHIDVDISYHYSKVKNIPNVKKTQGISLSVHYFV